MSGSWIKRHWTYLVGAAGIISAIIAVIAFLWPTEPPPGQNIVGDCAQLGDNNSCVVQEQAKEISLGGGTVQQLKNRIAEISQAPPKGTGPWPYYVYNTPSESEQDRGLKVKMAPSLEGKQVGSVSAGSLVWADCYIVNSYTPFVEELANVGPKWLQIHWPTDTPTITYNTSAPDAPNLEWTYAGYTIPFTHNGRIPKCQG
jgi:hypothetical protein